MVEARKAGGSNVLIETVRGAVSNSQTGHGRPGQINVGLVGRGIQRSRSPQLHEIEGARHGLDYHYALIDFDHLNLPESELSHAIELASSAGFAGLNVTHPFKEQVIPFLSKLTGDAKIIGSVNTIVFRAEGATGYNTDCWGFQQSFRKGLPGRENDVALLLGAGGAGRAVARALIKLGTPKLLIFDTNQRRATELSNALNSGRETPVAEAVDNVGAAAKRCRGIINASPMGMAKYPGIPVPESALTVDHWVADIVYFPERTALIAKAETLGCATLRGSGMAVYQAARAFELFTGREPDCERMLRSYSSTAPCGDGDTAP